MRFDLPREPEITERRKVEIVPDSVTRAPEVPVSPLTYRIHELLERARNYPIRHDARPLPPPAQERSPEHTIERTRMP
ncbi:MAG: hypothetical protein ACRD28_09295, partial [Acidobacteriaceae bacterium]